MRIRAPRIVVAATRSGAGKTTITCGLLRALETRGIRVHAAKCGPDYLDPLFHQETLGIPSRNLDLFLGDATLARQLVAEDAHSADLTLVEGVMGYYDGIACSQSASTYDVACALNAPVVLVVDARGRALSVAAEVAGFAQLRRPSHIAGVVLNHVSESYYPLLKEALERETSIAVLGYIPHLSEAELPSRHLGLVAPAEVTDLRKRIDVVSAQLSQTIDLDELIRIANTAKDLEVYCPESTSDHPAKEERTQGRGSGADACPRAVLREAQLSEHGHHPRTSRGPASDHPTPKEETSCHVAGAGACPRAVLREAELSEHGHHLRTSHRPASGCPAPREGVPSRGAGAGAYPRAVLREAQLSEHGHHLRTSHGTAPDRPTPKEGAPHRGACADACPRGVLREAQLSEHGHHPYASRDAAPIPPRPPHSAQPIIAVARDAAFAFYYTDALSLLESLGAKLAFFSPLEDEALPDGSSGVYLGGGYPELHAEQLSANGPMLKCVREAVREGMPTIAECGGFMYLQESLEDAHGTPWPMVGALEGRCFSRSRLGRFGYVSLEVRQSGLLADEGETLRAHEFHYWDSTMPGEAFRAQKPQSERSWTTGVHTSTLYAGYPHLYLPAYPEAARRFVSACTAFTTSKRRCEQ